jgi:Uma2 family endonuclease
VLLLVEVADTSLPYDREVKLRLYARAGIREVWLVDLTRNQVEVHLEPAPDGYRRSETRRAGDRLAPTALPEVSLSPAEILG